MSKMLSEAQIRETAELDWFSDCLMDYMFKRGYLSVSFRPWWQSRTGSAHVLPPAPALRLLRLICRDHLEMTRHWSAAEVQSLDERLETLDCITITALRQRVWRSRRRALPPLPAPPREDAPPASVT